MIAQLKNQDPFKPMDPAQFLGQLAQFGTVTGIQDMQGSFSTLSDSLRSAQVLGGTALVGRTVACRGQPGRHVHADGDAVPAGRGRCARGRLERSAGDHRFERHARPRSPSMRAAGRARLHVGRQHRRRRARACGQLQDRGDRQASAARPSRSTQLAGHVRASRSIRHRLLTLNTDTLGAIALSDVERVM